MGNDLRKYCHSSPLSQSVKDVINTINEACNNKTHFSHRHIMIRIMYCRTTHMQRRRCGVFCRYQIGNEQRTTNQMCQIRTAVAIKY